MSGWWKGRRASLRCWYPGRGVRVQVPPRTPDIPSMTEDEALDGDVVVDGRQQAFLRLKGGGWRHLDLVLTESGRPWQPEGELVLLKRRKKVRGSLSENDDGPTDSK